MAVEVRLLGNMEAYIDGTRVDLGHARQRCVLAVLLAEAGRPVPVDVLVNRIWADRPPQRERNALAGYLSRLRGMFAGATDVRFDRNADGYLLAVEPDVVDLHRFRRLVSRARAAEDDESAAKLYDEALGLWRGPAFATLDTPWLTAVRASLDADRLAARLDRNDVALRLGRHVDLLGELTALADEHPMDERLAGQLLLAFYRCGRQADALHHYERVRTRLADELGANPGPELRGLHQRMLRADPGLTAPPARSPRVRVTGPVPRQLPLAPVSFVGRVREVSFLDAGVASRGRAMVIQAIWGAPGVGKTTLALHWAHRVAGRYGDGQVYLNLRGFDPAGSTMSPAEALLVLLDSLGVSAQQMPATVEAQSALYRSLLAGKRMLVVLDNARDVDQVRPLLPGTPGCAVVVTSRNRLAGLVAGDGARPLSLDLLTLAESRELLADRIGPDRVATEPRSVDDIVARCAGLPLALAIVAARAATHAKLALGRVAAELGETGDTLTVLADDDPTLDVRTVFSWSYQTLSTEAGRLFRRLGLHPGPDIGIAAAASLDGTSIAAAGTAMAELVRANLATESAPRRYLLHDLIREYAAGLARVADHETERRVATTRLLDHYLHTGYTAAAAVDPHRFLITLPPPEAGTHVGVYSDLESALAWFRTEHEVLICVVSLAGREGFDRHAWQLAWTMTDYLDRKGHRQQELAVERAALAAARRTADNGAEAAVHRTLGRFQTTVGRLDEAVVHFRQALDLSTTLGDRPAVAYTHLSLSWVLSHQGNLAEAIEHDMRALELFRAMDDVPGQARSFNHLGAHRMEAGDHLLALDDCGAALELYHRVGHGFGEAATHDTLGQIHHHLGAHNEAVASFERSVELLRRLGDRYYEALTMTHLGDAHRDAGQVDAAHDAWRRALSILEELEHPDTDRVRAKLADRPDAA